MSKVIAFLMFLALVVFIAVVMAKEHSAPLAMPLIHAAVPSCPRLSNPCDRIDCNKPDTKGIA